MYAARKSLMLLLLLLMARQASGKYILSPDCKRAYVFYWSFRTQEGDAALARERQRDRDNLMVEYMANVSDFLQVFCLEDSKAYNDFIKRTDQRLDILNAGDRNSPYYSFCRAELFMHSAILKLKFGDNFSAAYDINKAYKALERCISAYPGFLPAQKDMLMMQAAVGTVPSSYRWMLRVFGFNGDLKSAVAQYRQLLDNIAQHEEYSLFLNESRIIYAFMSVYLMNDNEEAWRQASVATADYSTNPFASYIRAAIAIRIKHNNDAIESLGVQVSQPPVIPYLDYYMGIAKLERGDKEAGYYLARFIKNFKGQNYLKEAYLKLGWAFLLKGDMKNYERCIRLQGAFGVARLEEDKNAVKEAARPVPSIPLLRSRLYYDGGYYQKALAQLSTVSASTFATDIARAEYYYRYGRICEALESYPEAITNYNTVIRLYSQVADSYFAPASCLYIAMICEKKKDLAKAKSFYQKCLSYESYPYKDSFDQKAHAGLKRIE